MGDGEAAEQILNIVMFDILSHIISRKAVSAVKHKLQITFHNPNTTEKLVTELVKITAELAAKKMISELTLKNKTESLSL